MILSNAAIDRSTTVFVLLILIVMTGLYSYTSLPLERDPEIVIPFVVVTTTYEGVSPEDVESLLTIPIERELTGLDDVKEIRSTSAEGGSTIQIEFTSDVDIDDAMQKVRDKVDQAKPELPIEADDPIITEINIGELPIMDLALTGNVSRAVLTQFAEDLEDEIEAVRGVLDVEVVGGIEREIQIIVDPQLADAYGVPLSDLVTLAQIENVNTPAGSLDLGDAKFLMRVPGEFDNAAVIDDLVVKAGPDGVVYVRDIAQVVDGFKDETTRSRVDGRQAVTLTVSKRSGENVIEISDRVRGLIEEIRPRLLPGMELFVAVDTSTEIRDMVAELESSILSGLVLVLAVMFLFLGFVNAFFIAVAIPLSMLIAFACFLLLDTTLNMVVLFSLILALGMLVDNGIVVVENIYRHYDSGLTRVDAAKRGAGEVAWPIIASTTTTMAAFAPMFFWPGIWGEFMIYLPMTVTLTLAGSLFVGIVVNPALASRLMRKSSKKRVEATPANVHPVVRAYVALLSLTLRWRFATVTAAFMALLVIGAAYFAGARIEFTPETEPRRAFVDVDGPEGQNLFATDAIVATIEERVEAHRSMVDYIISNTGSRGVQEFRGDIGASGTTTHIGRVTLDFPRLLDAERLPSEVVTEVRDAFDDIAGAKITVEQLQEGPDAGPPINVELSGTDFETLARVAQDIAGVLETVPDVVDIEDDYEQGKPEIRVIVDREQALLTGLSTEYIGLTVQAAVNGRKAGEYREGDDEYDVTVRFPASFRADLTRIESMNLTTPDGVSIPFSSVARLEQNAGLGNITRVDRKRTITVSADVINRSGPEVLADVRAALADFPLPPGYTISYTGENEDVEETQTFLLNAFVIALFLIALVLITQFNSITQPLIILSSVILSLAGVFLGLLITDMAFGILMTGIGCISLAGVVVNNAIVLIDFINQRKAEGLPTHDAIIDAGTTRFRPVLLTAVTTILGLIPMALGINFDFRNFRFVVGGESSQWWGPMAVAVIFGLAFATVLTLIVVPVLYSLLDSMQAALAKRRVERPAAIPSEPIPAK